MDNSNSVFETIKSAVRSILPDARVLLFGSRARGDFNKHSDYDVLVITKETISLRKKLDFRGEINKTLVNVLRAPVDVLLNSEEEINNKKNLPGHIVKCAMNEGIEL